MPDASLRMAGPRLVMLVVSANPFDRRRLALGEEVREITAALRATLPGRLRFLDPDGASKLVTGQDLAAILARQAVASHDDVAALRALSAEPLPHLAGHGALPIDEGVAIERDLAAPLRQRAATGCLAPD